MTAPKGFNDWLAERLGTRQWVVAARLTDRLRTKGYTIAVTQKQFAALTAEHNALKQLDRAERIALRLFPDDFHDGHDCRAEIGREGQPCRICADDLERWRERIESVRAALAAEV